MAAGLPIHDFGNPAAINHEIEEGVKNAVDEIKNRFFSTTKRAIIAAIEDAYKRYADYVGEGGFKR